jgi:hypothetical protein
MAFALGEKKMWKCDPKTTSDKGVTYFRMSRNEKAII